MNIYHVERTDNYSYDDYSEFVCVAESVDAARRMGPTGDVFSPCTNLVRCDEDGRFYQLSHEGAKRYYGRTSWVYDISSVSVQLIGAAHPEDETEPRVVCASFHAG